MWYSELPKRLSAPPGKNGWPWTEGSPQPAHTTPDGSRWPRVSIVTPSYNQAQCLEETIRSVLMQGCPNLEYITFGGTDSSVDAARPTSRPESDQIAGIDGHRHPGYVASDMARSKTTIVAKANGGTAAKGKLSHRIGFVC